MEMVLKTTNLCKDYKKNKVLKNLEMNIPKGAIYGFVGRNGAGKTTLIRQICGLQLPTSGDYELFGISSKNKEIINSRKRMGAIVETPALYQGLSAVDNMKQQYLTLGLPSYEGIDEILSMVGLSDTGKKKVKAFSLGMRQRLAIAIALCGDPDFLVLDEPINGLDPQGIIEIRELILKLNKERGITILISSHILDELSKIATHYGFIENGAIVREMTAEELFKECGKSVQITVSDTKLASRILEEMGFEYKLLNDHAVAIFGSVKLSELALTFAKNGCELISMQEKDESLESFYLSLIGGKTNA